MIDEKELVEEYIPLIEKIDTTFRRISRNFYFSSPLVKYTLDNNVIYLDIKDLLLACAISGCNVIMYGRTGCGKTTLAKMLMKSLFNENYAFLQVDTKLDENKLRDIDFNKIKEGKKLSEAILETKFLTAPGVIIDEINRAPPTLFNILQNYLANGTIIFEGGREFYPGVEIENSKERYQLKIATMNIGTEYYGTFQIDKGVIDRFAVEINMDAFAPTLSDMRELILNTSSKVYENGEDNLNTVLKLYELTTKIPISNTALEFLLYFSRANQCIKSPSLTKLTIENLDSEFCKGCKAYALNMEICGNIQAPSVRTLSNWIRFARAIAMLRTYKIYKYSKDLNNSPKVTLEDLRAIAPFLLSSKLNINPEWKQKYVYGDRWYAVGIVLNIIYNRWCNGMKENEDILDIVVNQYNGDLDKLIDDYKTSNDNTKKQILQRIYSYCETDPWFFTPKCLKEMKKSWRKLEDDKK